jgi:hypothetical protein
MAQTTGQVWQPYDELRSDQERFVFLLGGSDGEQLFGPYPAAWPPLSTRGIFHEE